ncbi:MAG: MMPL family transporter, partial [Candidatus Dormibacteraeota bacterium]|nr:MMPL family transporter [Candidatus Dormibacteraeota bacterium]
MARRPLMVLLIALLACAGLATGFVRFGVDAGQSLLVGSNSSAGHANQGFTKSFGADPIVVVLTAGNPTAPYLEKNLQRLTALEQDLAHDPRVAQVLGPGTVANSALSATTAEVSKVLTEYPNFVAETAYLDARQKGQNDATKLQAQFQTNVTNALQLLELYVARAAADAHQARQAYAQKPIPAGDRILDSQEKAAEKAVVSDPLPPLFAEYLAGPGNTVDTPSSRVFFDRLTAAFGDCDSSIAQLLGINPTCQIYVARILLDLPNCPTEATVQAASARGQEVFCNPKSAWAAVLPTPSTNANGAIVAREVLTVRLTSAAAADRTSVLAIRQKISDELSQGIAVDAFTKGFSAAQLTQLKQLGPLAPSDCGGTSQQQNATCYTRYHDRPFQFVIAGAPLLTYGVVDSMSQTLIILLPVVMVLMALLLVVAFRVRGRLWPLLAAVGAGGATVGLSLWLGIPVTPAVLAGVPVLVGLAVDYAVQLVARYDEGRRRGATREAAIEEAMLRSGPATFTAAVATLAGFGTLMVFAGIDAGPLVAIPLVAEFALVLFIGVIVSWLAALFIALPAAALWGRAGAESATVPPVETRPERTLGIAGAWRGVVVPAVIVALLGWVLLPRIPVQTQVDSLLASSLPQLQDINTVRDQTGYGNEVDIYLQGPVAGPYNQPGIPGTVTWQCQVSQAIRTHDANQVATAVSIADFFIAASSSASAPTSAPCVSAVPAATNGATPPSPGATPSTAPSATASPAVSPSASSSRKAIHDDTGSIQLAATTLTPSPATQPPGTLATASASPSGTASPSASASTGATPQPSTVAPRQTKTQTAFLCDLRLLPALARNLVQDIPTSTQGCPAIDKYLNTWLTTDTTPIDPKSARIVIGVVGTSIADQARLIDSVRNEIANPPNGITAAPAGIAALAAQAYDNIVARSLWLNLLPLVVVFLALLAIERNLRRAALPLLPTAIAAGWAPLILLLLGLLPGELGKTLGSFNPLTVVLGALVIALATEFGVVLLRRFDEECAKGLHPDDAAAATLAVTGKAIRVSALTLGAGFAVLALSALLPHGLPLLGAFGLTVVIDLGLAVAAVFGIMLPVAVAIERSRWEPERAPASASPAPATPALSRRRPDPESEVVTPRRRPSPAPRTETEADRRRRGATAAAGSPPPPSDAAGETTPARTGGSGFRR